VPLRKPAPTYKRQKLLLSTTILLNTLPQPDMITLEVCANSVTSALAAQEGGAVRVELCDNLNEGGTTPSFGQIALARKLLQIQLFVIIRPRGGDFLYSELEFEIMKEDIRRCVELNCDGVVLGILLPNGQVDKERCRELLTLAKPLPATFHRAFDMCVDPFQALEDIIALGFTRILTSGGENTAAAGVSLITQLIKQANNRISIMPGSGINEQNLEMLLQKTGAREFHTAAKSRVASAMVYRNSKAAMGSQADEYTSELTNSRRVKNLVKIARQVSALS